MKLRVIAKNKNGKDANLELKKDKKFYLHNEVFEVEDERGKELLDSKWEDNPVVEEVKEAAVEEVPTEVVKNKNKNKVNTVEEED